MSRIRGVEGSSRNSSRGPSPVRAAGFEGGQSPEGEGEGFVGVPGEGGEGREELLAEASLTLLSMGPSQPRAMLQLPGSFQGQGCASAPSSPAQTQSRGSPRAPVTTASASSVAFQALVNSRAALRAQEGGGGPGASEQHQGGSTPPPGLPPGPDTTSLGSCSFGSHYSRLFHSVLSDSGDEATSCWQAAQGLAWLSVRPPAVAGQGQGRAWHQGTPSAAAAAAWLTPTPGKRGWVGRAAAAAAAEAAAVAAGVGVGVGVGTAGQQRKAAAGGQGGSRRGAAAAKLAAARAAAEASQAAAEGGSAAGADAMDVAATDSPAAAAAGAGGSGTGQGGRAGAAVHGTEGSGSDSDSLPLLQLCSRPCPSQSRTPSLPPPPQAAAPSTAAAPALTAAGPGLGRYAGAAEMQGQGQGQGQDEALQPHLPSSQTHHRAPPNLVHHPMSHLDSQRDPSQYWLEISIGAAAAGTSRSVSLSKSEAGHKQSEAEKQKCKKATAAPALVSASNPGSCLPALPPSSLLPPEQPMEQVSSQGVDGRVPQPPAQPALVADQGPGGPEPLLLGDCTQRHTLQQQQGEQQQGVQQQGVQQQGQQQQGVQQQGVQQQGQQQQGVQQQGPHGLVGGAGEQAFLPPRPQPAPQACTPPGASGPPHCQVNGGACVSWEGERGSKVEVDEAGAARGPEGWGHEGDGESERKREQQWEEPLPPSLPVLPADEAAAAHVLAEGLAVCHARRQMLMRGAVHKQVTHLLRFSSPSLTKVLHLVQVGVSHTSAAMVGLQALGLDGEALAGFEKAVKRVRGALMLMEAA
ncbi:hypothetical protein QJQ45_028986 [Haematococcus lacustris]|nr:hypothetical protein QJQ45_028986 [Haematococcus lacustris]